MSKIITIDSRECGAGKTRTGTYQEIINHTILKQPVLVVVPSHELQKQYARDLAEKNISCHVINCDKKQIGLNTVQSIQTAMENLKTPLIITNAAFTVMPHVQTRYHLIIDEAFEPVKLLSFNQNFKEDHRQDFGWKDCFVLEDDQEQLFQECKTELTNIANQENIIKAQSKNNAEMVEDLIEDPAKLLTKILQQKQSYEKLMAGNYVEIKKVSNPSETLATQNNIIDMLKHPNYRAYTSMTYWDRFVNNISGEIKFVFEFDASIYVKYSSVYIAAARFEYTLMGIQLVGARDSSNNLLYNIRYIHKFTPHTANITFHYFGGKLRFSNSKRREHPEFIGEMSRYISETRTGPLLVLKNNDETVSFDQSHLLSHNSHGLNLKEYQACQDICLLSALITDTFEQGFIKHRFGDVLEIAERTSGTTFQEYIRHFRSSYLFYQSVMRSALRNKTTNTVNIYAMDEAEVLTLMTYFTGKIEFKEIPLPASYVNKTTSTPNKKPGRKKKYATEEEQKAALRARVAKFRNKTK